MEENNKYTYYNPIAYTPSLKLFSFEKFCSNDILTRRNRVKRQCPPLPTHVKLKKYVSHANGLKYIL